ncbi:MULTISPECIES: nucleotidyltransferase family protein [unclassified Herbaspirillum]|uniref:nucleotidyltransferase family protein n=1 Tax=unclassified Herbaspirillum TaxID=2624150 RepID=UPI000E2EB181|nr:MULTISPECIES: nucleotidyltransferase family protein [unclassified Herbaspirillum]RFB71080.1 nucleotidyltransferase family protein [Herbaspirillum sp. 3R-3a1]TFI08396.1 nucleotidyltransferase family protein [Herbaspirillum sp. 3R11]TFI14811.1 nucleotidyltransferase family protein [Herbaspirillum sp. 3R-11]TFI29399.1 nucleotidyltransferase family protein [Herbaspirillum sp. 3C11]
MRALLLAAGLGTRLQPLTNFLPKCLVPINGRPLLDYWIENLLAQGVDEILINTHYRATLVADYIDQSSWDRRVVLVHEEHLLGTAGTALANRDFFRNEPFLIAHADNLTRFDCAEFIDAHRRRPVDAALTMMLFETGDPRSCGIVDLDEKGLVQAFHEKVENPPGNLANAAVYIVEPSVVGFMAALGKSEIDFSTEIIPHFVGRISTFLNSAYHRDIGTIKSWTDAQQDFGMPPALPQNARAWEKLIASVGSDLPELMANLTIK